jgi:electron transport complex protein RnfC
MSALLLILLLYNAPRFVKEPGAIPPMLLLVVIGLVLDAAAHFILYKKPVCAVSAAVTALILWSLSPGAPFWGECAALGVALIAGKFIGGGTGKNPLNPAMLGLAVLALLLPVDSPPFEPTLLLLPAVLLSLPFLFIRTYAGVGMMLGMAAALFLQNNLTVEALFSGGVFFWSCLVITDPVTTTSKPAAGFIIGALAGFVPVMTGNTPAAMPLGILVSNILSYQADRMKLFNIERLRKTFDRGQRIPFSPGGTPFTDLTDTEEQALPENDPDCETILRRIEKHAVTGCGGAAFPTITKLRAAIDAALPEKHLIINAVECDPGLIHDKWLLTNRRDEIERGIGLLTKCADFSSVTIAAKAFHGAGFAPPVRLHKARDYYPAGAERTLIRDVLKIELRPDEIPSMCGILVLNVQTVIAVAEAVLLDRDADTRYITAADFGKRTGAVARVRMGGNVLEAVKKVFPGAVNVYTGGGAMSARLSDDASVIGVKTNFIAVGTHKGFREAVCSQCGFCSAYCPASLPVREIGQLVDAGKTEKTARFHPEKCIECNLCSAVCLAGRDQAARLREAGKSARR